MELAASSVGSEASLQQQLLCKVSEFPRPEGQHHLLFINMAGETPNQTGAGRSHPFPFCLVGRLKSEKRENMYLCHRKQNLTRLSEEPPGGCVSQDILNKSLCFSKEHSAVFLALH